jgi:eukaryotic-like serine/threonine-protein kinase
MIVDRDRLARLLPGYELGQELGSGAFGIVLEGRRLRLNRKVAIKVLAAPSRASAAAIVDEPSLLAQMDDHPHIVRVYDCVEGEGLCLIIMELLAGGRLRDRMPISPEGACAVGIAIAEALSYAHRRDVLHRDIKPENVLFDTGGLPKVTDFGVAKILEDSVAWVNSGAGTPPYMSPEQLDAGPLGPASDIYSVGVVLFELFTGRLPFVSNESGRRRTGTVPRLAGVPSAVADVVTRALNPDPRRRYASAHQFALELADAADRGYGPDWRARSGIMLRTGEAMNGTLVDPGPRPKQGRPKQARPKQARPVSSGPSSARIRTGASQDPALVPTGPPVVPHHWSRSSGGERRPRRRDRRVPLILGAALTAALGVVVAFVVSQAGTGRGPTVQLSAGNPTPNNRTGASVAAHSASPHPASPHPVAGGPVPFSPTGFIPDSVAFGPGGNILAVAATAPGGGNGNTYLWNPAVGSVSILHDPGSHGAQSVAFSPDGTTLAVGDADGDIYLWKLATGAHTALHDPGSKGVQAVAFARKGTVLAAGDANGSTYLWNWATGARVGTALHDSGSQGVQAVAFSPDGATLATGDADGDIYLWNWAAGARPRTLTDPSAPGIVSISADVEAVAFAPMGTVLAAGDANGATYLWNWATGKMTGTLMDPDGQGVQALAFSPDGTVLAVGDADASAYLWNWAAATVTRTLHAAQETHGVGSVAFSRDGTEFAAGDHAGSTFVWHL